MNVIQRLKNLWDMSVSIERNGDEIAVVIEPQPITIIDKESTRLEPFVIFPCDEKCGEQISLMEHIQSGEAAVLKCQNCDTSWTVYSPPLEIMRTKKAEFVWKDLANDPMK